MQLPNYNSKNIPLVDHPMAQDYKRKSIGFGLKTLSDAIQGLSKQELIFITGAPGCGKSQLARGICLDLIDKSCLCTYVSYELGYGQLLDMFLLAGLGDKENKRLVLSPEDIAERDITFIENLVEKNPMDLLVVDDIHALTMKYAFEPRIADNMASYLRGFADRLKELARRKNIIIITMVHSKQNSIDNKESSLSDMAYSGGFAQVGDTVLAIRKDKKTGDALIDVTKARYTGGKITVRCKSVNKKFIEITNQYEPTPAELVNNLFD